MRGTDIAFAFPAIMLAIAVAAMRGPSFSSAVLAMTIVFIAPITRVARGAAVEIASKPYIEAARLSGAGTFRVVRDFGLPNMLPPVLVFAASQLGGFLIFGAGLSFLGAGAQPPDIEWGRMVADARPVFLINAWPSVLSGLLIFVVSIAFNLLADRLRDRLDPRWRASQ
jgi:peptide/nickel transport system permease protein